MQLHEAQEVIACLPGGRTLYDYAKDRYAVDLLRWSIGAGRSIRSLKSSSFGRLLERKPVREVVRDCGDGCLTPERLAQARLPEALPFRLSLGIWGEDRDAGESASWYQTTRAGCSLVLRLDLTNLHLSEARRLLGASSFRCFRFLCHPTTERTLAWVRMDVDLMRRAALIDEIQNDWIRLADWEWSDFKDEDPYKRMEGWYGINCRPRDFLAYLNGQLQPYREIWAEAMLHAALWFCRAELGLDRVYYHTVAWGSKVKRMQDAPPQWLYRQLPRAFGFQAHRGWPDFLAPWVARHRRLRRLRPEFQVLALR